MIEQVAPPAPAGPVPRVAELVAARRGRSVSVVLPALDEAATIGPVVAAATALVGLGVVDEVVVMDSGSTDATAAVAAAAGARVYHRDDVAAELGSLPGKGEVMWKSLAVTRGDVVVFVDADLLELSVEQLLRLVAPMLLDDTLVLAKAAWDRPLGRVTELVARPLLALYWPALAGVAQPLAGEYAVRRDLLEAVPFPTGYGVDIALLIEALARFGAPAITQVDLGTRLHRHQGDQQLGVMAAEVADAALRRLGIAPSGSRLTRFDRTAGALEPVTAQLAQRERPPWRAVGTPVPG